MRNSLENEGLDICGTKAEYMACNSKGSEIGHEAPIVIDEL